VTHLEREVTNDTITLSFVMKVSGDPDDDLLYKKTLPSIEISVNFAD
jgi:hypothetical protein